MVETDVQSLGPEHPSVARDLSGLAAVYLVQRKYDDAKPLLMRAMAIYRKVYTPDAILVRRTQGIVGCNCAGAERA